MGAPARADEVRFVTISDGVVAQVVERTPPIPRRLDPLLASIRVLRRWPARILGARRACTDAEHAFQPWLDGIYNGLELRLALCPFCGVVEVRDVSLDLIPGLSSGVLEPRRRDDVLGWYSGRRQAARVYL